MTIDQMPMQTAFIHDAQSVILEDERIRAAWLEGSFGRGNADRYSDVDLHLLLAPESEEDFRASARSWLEALRPLALYKLLFDNRMINAMDFDALRYDIWMHSGLWAQVDREKIRVLKEEPGSLLPKETPPTEAGSQAGRLAEMIAEFWRCVGLLPVVIGRRELLVGFTGINVEQQLVIDILCNGYGIVRESGVKKLNPFLPDDLRTQLEAALQMDGLTSESIATANLRLAALVHLHGPMLAHRHNVTYPQALEASVLAYVRQTLAETDLQDALALGQDLGLFPR